MHLLPILWASEPTSDGWTALSRAREALGVTEKIQPARAVPGSPGRVLVVGEVDPDWVCDYAFVRTVSSPDLPLALGWCLGMNDYENVGKPEDQLSKWLGGEVKFIREEEFDGN